MHGNVFEWCQDAFDGSFYSKPEASEKDPVCREGVNRAARAGCPVSDARGCRAELRFSTEPLLRSGGLGLRLTRGLVRVVSKNSTEP